MKIIITGATGMVGSEVLLQAFFDKDITEITAIVRKPLAVDHPKLRMIIHYDFLNYSSLAEAFKNNDACIWCLGISQNAVSEEEYIKITYDYALAAAKEMLAANPSINFLFLSGDGASSDEKSRFLFGRIKGKTENALLKLPFQKFFIARPGAILPPTNNPNFSFLLRLQYGLVRIIKVFAPSFVITSSELAIALLYLMKHGSDQFLFTHRDLKLLAKKAVSLKA